MKKQMVYEKAPASMSQAIEESRVIKDFLPSPEKLLAHESSVKVTLSRSKDSIDSFKEKAVENHVPYQKMLRKVIDLYVALHMKNVN